ncbi:DUF3667 domain-containing protein [Hymenobacter psychrotolerans]|uniref:DUF3667 domain-containing protein n=1 Tax=Hymenobacter psychrotolerans DSM 18569 TaxID=1121959 RepID=A0A1M6Y461_9BACT|nr:DUF3667 domain-containing protein [Hymenobacter psychrotolerans]SHL13002.1 Protein of unknown function [Hymenobacter psychrotolerans DSM 18569]
MEALAQAASPATTHPTATQQACLNCGTALHDRFCAHCGQPANTHRLTMAHWLHDIPHSIWHVDKGLPYTLGQMLRRPGPALRRYLAGQRVPFFRPLTYVLLITGLITFCYVVLHLRPYNTHDPSIPPAVQAMQERFLQFFSRYINWFTVALLPLTALVARLCLRRGGFNYAEALTITTYVTGTYHFLTLLVLPVLYLLNGTQQGQQVMGGLLLVSFAYQTWAYASLLQGTSLSVAGRVWRGLATTVGSYALILLSALALLVSINWEQIMAMTRQ